MVNSEAGVARSWPRVSSTALHHNQWVVVIGLAIGLAALMGPFCSLAPGQSPKADGSESWTSSVTTPLKEGFTKLGRALDPKLSHPNAPEDDAILLKSKSKPGPGLYVAIAHLYEQSGKVAEAEQQYQLALHERPNDLPALLGYARLKDATGKPIEALPLYQRAVTTNPQEASVHNHLGLYYARQNQLDDAVAALSRAIQLEPKNPLYRNNLATVLVDQGRLREAYSHLRGAHGSAAAYYNLGYLLQKKGDSQAALQHFLLAQKADPSLAEARLWADYLQRATTRTRLPGHPAAAGLRITSATAASSVRFPPPETPEPRRLPPTALRASEPDGPRLPGISYDNRTLPTAPLPPVSQSSAVRPLPRVR